MSPPDALEALRYANPVPEGSVALHDPDALLRDVLAGLARRPRRAPEPRRVAALVGVSAVAVGGLVGARHLLSEPVTDPISVACYSGASLDARSVVEAVRGDPVERCRQVWRAGAFGSPAEPPPLVDCVLASGMVGVFPGSSPATCDSVGAARSRPGGPEPTMPPGPGLGDATDATELRAALTGAISGVRCRTYDDARDIVARELAARGLTGWRIEEGAGAGGGFDAVRRCASVDIDAERHVVILVPIPESAPPGPTRR